MLSYNAIDSVKLSNVYELKPILDIILTVYVEQPNFIKCKITFYNIINLFLRLISSIFFHKYLNFQHAMNLSNFHHKCIILQHGY